TVDTVGKVLVTFDGVEGHEDDDEEESAAPKAESTESTPAPAQASGKGIFEFKLPDIGEGIHEGEIVKWFIQPGDKVEEDQSIFEVQNDKSVEELTSPVSGTIKQIKAAECTYATVGQLLVTFTCI
ncbi:biotin/lipoyl-containing protein, partial [Escherichia coli]|uniref:biotin/lipoyl-containing protein n=1 Tax=Escherichia coli TaxID=562 RepID=UPI0025A07FB1